MNDVTAAPRTTVSGPPKITEFDHLSLPCRDLEEGIKFYTRVLGAKQVSKERAFESYALFTIAGIRLGISSEGNSFMDTPGAEYPHLAFRVGPAEIDQMRAWLDACGIPMTDLYTRKNQVTLMFFRDPSGNLIELFCDENYPGSEKLPVGTRARAHGDTVDVDEIRYDSWKLPAE